MKKILMFSMVVLFALFTVNPAVYANPAEAETMPASPITVQINGSLVNAPADMDVKEGQVMVPLSWMAGQLGASSVQWDPATRTITIVTPQDFYSMEKLNAYAQALQANPNEQSRQLCPLPDKAKNLNLSDSELNPNLVLELKQFSPEAVSQTPTGERDHINIHIISNDGTYEHSSIVYSIENHTDHYYLPMDWLEYLFNVRVNYEPAANTLSIQTPDLEKIKSELALIENTLVSSTADDAVLLWGRGEQTRNGALQWSALAPQLRQEADKSDYVHYSYWVTGDSSPWVGPITIKTRDKIDNGTFIYTISFPEVTSDPFNNKTATEKMMVERFPLNGQDGWHITKIMQSSGYGIIDDGQ